MKSVFVLLCVSFSTMVFAQSGRSIMGGTPKPFVLGQVEEISSFVLSEKRTLNIYLPEGYNPKDSLKYPVVYLLDGSADEDFIHIVGLYQFYTFPWINRVP